MATKSEKHGQSLIDVGEAKSLKQKALTSLHPLPPGVNPDLAEERSRPCSFSQTELTELIDGGREKTEERKRLEEIFLDSRQVSKGSTRIKVFLGKKRTKQTAAMDRIFVEFHRFQMCSLRPWAVWRGTRWVE